MGKLKAADCPNLHMLDIQKPWIDAASSRGQLLDAMHLERQNIPSCNFPSQTFKAPGHRDSSRKELRE